MPSDGPVLAFDTSAAHCAAALLDPDTELVLRHTPMKRGQSEALFPILEELLTSQGLGWSDLMRIGVGIGPGNFTGIRIAVASARGLSLSLGIPAIGVSSFEAARYGQASSSAVAIPATRDQVYFSAEGDTAQLLPANQAPEALGLPDPETLVSRIAHIAAASEQTAAPAPLYLRPADAAPASDPPPRLLDDA